MNRESLTSAPEIGTLRAFDPARRVTITFTDYVRDGEVVDIYRSEEAAANESGPWTRMRVAWDGEDEWVLEAVDD